MQARTGPHSLEAANELLLRHAAVAILVDGDNGADDGASGHKGDEDHENEHGRAFRREVDGRIIAGVCPVTDTFIRPPTTFQHNRTVLH